MIDDEEYAAWQRVYYALCHRDFSDCAPADILKVLQALYAEHGYDRLKPLEVPARFATVNPYWEIVQWLPSGGPLVWRPGERAVDPGHFLRRRLVREYSWAIPAPDDLEFLANALEGRSVLEVGAGAGYWAWQLSQVGVDILPYDMAPTGSLWHDIPTTGDLWTEVLEAPSTVAGDYPDRALMMVWPPYNTAMALDALRAYRGNMLVYVGEDHGGCTGDDEFHELIEAEWEEIGHNQSHPTYAGISCRLLVYRRKGQRS